MTKTPQDFDPEDSSLDNGLECCAKCELTLSSEHGHHGEIYTQAGRSYEHLLNSDPGESPFFCPECWEILETNKRKQANQSLSDFQ